MSSSTLRNVGETIAVSLLKHRSASSYEPSIHDGRRRRGRAKQAAGITHRVDGETAGNCLTFSKRPTTPENIKIYRKSYFGPGQRRIHPGIINDMKKLSKERSKLSKSDSRFGISSVGSLHVDDVFAQGPQTAVDEALNDNLERNYHSKKSCLGKITSHGHVLPEKMRTGDFRFGKVDAKRSETAIEAIFPKECVQNTEEDIERYKKSHAAFAPGEQLKRDYDWKKTGMNPRTYRFGKIMSTDGNSTAQCLNENNGSTEQDTKIVSKETMDHRRTKDRLGKCRELGLRPANDADMTFGVKSNIVNEWGAAECIRGDYTEEEQGPDKDLGRATRPGYRNFNVPGRTFGTPSIRNDIPLPAKRSVADAQNYGTDATAQELLYPSRFNGIGVNEDDFTRPRDPQQIREIFNAIGKTFDDHTFACIWWRAAQTGRWSKHDAVCVQDFRSIATEVEEGRQAHGDANPVPWWKDASLWASSVLASSK